MQIAIYTLTHLAGLGAATWWLSGMAFSGAVGGTGEFYAKIGPMLVLAAILGVVAAALKPDTKFLAWPTLILTLGVFLFGLNALMIAGIGWVSESNDLAFRIGGLDDALWCAAIITGVTVAMQLVSGKE